MSARSARLGPRSLFFVATLALVGAGALFATLGFRYSWLYVFVGISLLGATAAILYRLSG